MSPNLRDHEPVVIEDFNGLWNRGDEDSCPLDHWTDCNNVEFTESGFRTRDGLNTIFGIKNVKRMYNFNISTSDGYIVLNSSGQFYHIIPATSSSTLILTVINADDFFMVNYNERAYINPIRNGSALVDFLYVYKGNGTAARKAGGAHPVLADGNLTAANSATAGNVEAGIHVFGAVYETDTGFLTSVGDVLASVNADGTHQVTLTNIPVSPNSYVSKVHILASKSIDPTLFTGDLKQYEPFFIPGAIVNNGVTTLTVNFYDAELLTSADNLFDLQDTISNGFGPLALFHNRVLLIGNQTTNDKDIVLVSNPGEPEAFDSISGFLTLPHDGLAISNAQEYRDILYVTKINQTVAFSDSGGDPVSWPFSFIEEGLGAGQHLIAFIGARGALTIEYMLIANYEGVFLFQGVFARPAGELSFKIKDFWIGNDTYVALDQTEIAQKMQMYNDPIHQLIYINIPSRKMILIGDYANGLNAQDIRWSKWTTDVEPTSITLFDKTNILVIGSLT